MKKLLAAAAILLLLNSGAQAQNRQIEFTTGPFAEVLAKAAAEDKMIFVDVYTTWCGPCKRLAADVFTLDSVADFHNTNFINFKYDKENDPELAIDNPYGMPAVPTLLYINPQGKVVHAMVGAYPDRFLAEGRRALDSSNNLAGLDARYKGGERSAGLLRQYVDALTIAYQPTAAAVAAEYLASLSDEEFYTVDAWQVIAKHVKDVLDPIWQKAVVNRNRFIPAVAREVIDAKIASDLLAANAPYHHWQPGEPLDVERGRLLIECYRTVAQDRVPAFIGEMLIVLAQHKGDYAEMLSVLKEFTAHNAWNKYLIFSLTDNLKRFAMCTDKEVIGQGVEWMDQLLTYNYDEYIINLIRGHRDELAAKLAE